MRLFVGVWLSEAMQEEVVRFINQVKSKSSHSGFKWSTPENLHFTLKFFGDVDERRLPELNRCLQQAATQNQSFHFKLGSIGFFPPKGFPRIVWIGVSQGSSELAKLAESVEEYSFRSDFIKSDKPFKAHLTIGRAKNEFSAPRLPEMKGEFKTETNVTEFSLIVSRLLSSGPVYENLETFRLAN